jgi:hypothetical protein
MHQSTQPLRLCKAIRFSFRQVTELAPLYSVSQPSTLNPQLSTLNYLVRRRHPLVSLRHADSPPRLPLRHSRPHGSRFRTTPQPPLRRTKNRQSPLVHRGSWSRNIDLCRRPTSHPNRNGRTPARPRITRKIQDHLSRSNPRLRHPRLPCSRQRPLLRPQQGYSHLRSPREINAVRHTKRPKKYFPLGQPLSH